MIIGMAESSKKMIVIEVIASGICPPEKHC